MEQPKPRYQFFIILKPTIICQINETICAILILAKSGIIVDALLWVLESARLNTVKTKTGMISKKTAAEIFMNRGLTNTLFAKTNETKAEPRNPSGQNMKNKVISLIAMFETFAVSFAIIIAGSTDQAIMPPN